MVSVFFWAILFYLFRDYGFVDITTYVSAMIISLETITTVGYSVTDITFGDHPIAFVLLYCEMMQAILMNSFCIGLIYTRLSRAIVVLSLPSSPDPLAFADLLSEGGDSARGRAVELRVPSVRAAATAAAGEPRVGVLRAEDAERDERRSVPDDAHGADGRHVTSL